MYGLEFHHGRKARDQCRAIQEARLEAPTGTGCRIGEAELLPDIYCSKDPVCAGLFLGTLESSFVFPKAMSRLGKESNQTVKVPIRLSSQEGQLPLLALMGHLGAGRMGPKRLAGHIAVSQQREAMVYGAKALNLYDMHSKDKCGVYAPKSFRCEYSRR